MGYASYDNRLFPFYAHWLPTHEPQRDTFFPSGQHPYILYDIFMIFYFYDQKIINKKENHKDIIFQSQEQVLVKFHRQSGCDRTSLSVHPLTSVIYDNIYQQTFDPLPNLSCKFRELISRTRDENYTVTETTVAHESSSLL